MHTKMPKNAMHARIEPIPSLCVTAVAFFGMSCACVAYGRLEPVFNIGIGIGRFDNANIDTSDVGIKPRIGRFLVDT